jgi:hypothetical protein
MRYVQFAAGRIPDLTLPPPRPLCARPGDILHAAFSQEPDLPMTTFVNALVPVAVGAVAVVLLLGLANMLRGGSASRAQSLMRLRVLLQFGAIIIIMGVIWFRSG